MVVESVTFLDTIILEVSLQVITRYFSSLSLSLSLSLSHVF